MKLKTQGIEVIGVSGDSVQNHQLFKKVHKLNFALLADETGVVAKAFGVPTRDGGTINIKVQGKQVSLTRGVTASRWTFIVDKDGKVVYKNEVKAPAEDSKAVQKFLKKAS